jgi:hypothetical protein
VLSPHAQLLHTPSYVEKLELAKLNQPPLTQGLGVCESYVEKLELANHTGVLCEANSKP